MKKNISLALIVLFSCLISSCFKETFLPIRADFEARYKNDNKAAPVAITLHNLSEGAEKFKWTFEGANLSNSNERTPPELVYAKPGKYNITLEVSNLDGQTATKTIALTVGDKMMPNFGFTFDVNDYAPAKVIFKNNSVGANRYEWTFEKGDKTTSTDQNPTIVFNEEGEFKISLKLFNGSSFVKLDSTIKIKPALAPNFIHKDLNYNFNYEAPLSLRLTNTSKGALSHQWAVDDPAVQIKAVSDSIITLTLPQAKKYKITLTASNNKQTKAIEQEITVNSNSNLLTFKDVKFGIPQQSFHANYYISRRNQLVPTTSLDTLSFGRELDVVFFSRDEDYSYCRFMSPDNTASLLMKAVPNAQKTIFINVLEGCAPCTQITDDIFNNLKTAKDIQTLNLKFGEGIVEGFTNDKQPRYVPFKTADGRLGIIKIKSFENQYINTDIKVYRK